MSTIPCWRTRLIRNYQRRKGKLHGRSLRMKRKVLLTQYNRESWVSFFIIYSYNWFKHRSPELGSKYPLFNLWKLLVRFEFEYTCWYLSLCKMMMMNGSIKSILLYWQIKCIFWEKNVILRGTLLYAVTAH